MFSVGVLSGAAGADPVDGNAARKMLFSPRTAEVDINQAAGLSETDKTTLAAMVRMNGLKYYGAIAFSPDEGLVSEALQGAFNFHGVGPAEVAALAACNKARKGGTAPCVIAATVLPKRWKERPLQLSQDATATFAVYRKGRGEKAIAISLSSGAYGMAKGDGSAAKAMSDCTAKANGATDCIIVIAD
jgi:hypothetical protein